MAKKNKQKVQTITIQDLVDEYGLDARVIRATARKIGLSATPTEIEGFGPRARYEWAEDSDELAELTEALEEKISPSEDEELDEEEELEEEE